MNDNIKVGIYSGEIPAPTFIEHLIVGLGLNSNYCINVFGKQKGNSNYPKSVKVFGTPSNKYYNVLITCCRTLSLILFHFNRFRVLKAEIKTYKGIYLKWQWWSRYVPVLLHLPDLIHIQWVKDLKHWVFLKENFDCKIVVSLLGSHINYSPIVDPTLASNYKINFSKVDAFHAVSEAIKHESLLYGTTEKNVFKIHTTLSELLPKSYNYQSINNTPIKILSIGRYHWVKGYRYALFAMNLLKLKKVNFSYTIIGYGNPSEELVYLRNELELNEEVIFSEARINQTDLFDKMKNYDILLLPSLSEGIANVVLEAMILGIPVISTDCGGMKEVVIPNYSGWLVPVRNPESMAEAVLKVKETPQHELQKITKNAFDFVKLHFNSEDSIQQFMNLYKRITTIS